MEKKEMDLLSRHFGADKPEEPQVFPVSYDPTIKAVARVADPEVIVIEATDYSGLITGSQAETNQDTL